MYVSDTYYPYFKGGKEKRLYELSTRLARLGHDVHVYTMQWWPVADGTTLEADGVTLHAICKLHPLYKGDRRSIAEGVLFGLACLRLLRVKFDILDVDHMPFFPVYSCWLVTLLRGRHRQFFGTWHEALSLEDWRVYMGRAGIIAALIERVSIRLPYAISAASEHTRRLILTELKRSQRVSVIPSGVDTRLIAGLKPFSKRCDVLYTGRLVKDKNIDKLVEAVSILVRSRPDISCLIVGHGNELDNLQAQIKQLKLGDNIRLQPPFADFHDVYRQMKAARVFCLPSVREGFGIVALEALACATPVVTTDSGSNAARDLLLNPVAGMAVELTPSAVAEAIEDLLGRRRSKKVAEVASVYDWDEVAGRQAGVYAG